MQIFRSNGKILLTGEYAVLDGALALALPSKKGQTMIVESAAEGKIAWHNFDENGKLWFESHFSIEADRIKSVKKDEFSPDDPEGKAIDERLEQILNAAFKLNKNAFSGKGYKITNRLDFNRKWGLGTSSTLINNLAQWLNIDHYLLLERTFGGSGYDIAAASNDQPVLFQITEHGPESFKTHFAPEFVEHLFFVYLNRKQNSREAIAHYRKQSKDQNAELVKKISGITTQLLESENLEQFRLLLEAHESLISQAIKLPKIKNQLFPDFPGTLKSLGGWGGDFILAIGNEKEKEYFRRKGYSTIFDYTELIK
ncbi:GHMP kinase [Christiangramia fulva]|uniref:GHMP kinase n=1 Tax=Christiangramia fulva TaxID=2126553 RepID=A0A2R3Z214_9FLAO|nr:GYDIA family GHMP kinase [Christiangramia fulva]AVR44321.1 GHMP kinase [Christiangramia fulva]